MESKLTLTELNFAIFLGSRKIPLSKNVFLSN